MDKQERFARTVLNGFESYFADFQNITLAAKSRFENGDWHGMHAASAQRIDLYKLKTTKVYEYVELIAGDQLHSDVVTSTSGYNIFQSEFQTLMAEKGARKRALDDLAQQIRMRLASYLINSHSEVLRQ